ncbi:uncharacterized protein N7511_007095 [Penicillium nucicola]|uniref:uncharacterized protein n=1 Tax=Penicillium nucicola TaxID=1850975 RepID=UPI00254556BC|nr:uncharacterized protein N7511_007095 [Penicillium nucicola]KAJ5756913.1 hypothetical protein N7511_007095 [Penicillium nucicola]
MDPYKIQIIKEIACSDSSSISGVDLDGHKILLLVRGNPDRLVWVDFDVATTFTDFGPEQIACCDHEIAVVKGFGDALRDDQAEGLPPYTKFY